MYFYWDQWEGPSFCGGTGEMDLVLELCHQFIVWEEIHVGGLWITVKPKPDAAESIALMNEIDRVAASLRGW